MRVLCAILLAILPVTIPAAAQQFSVASLVHQPLTNDSVVTLAKAGFDEMFILQLIRNSRTNFDTSVQGLVGLKQAGISEELIRLMAMPLVVPPPTAPPAATPPPKVPGKWHSLLPWKHSSSRL